MKTGIAVGFGLAICVAVSCSTAPDSERSGVSPSPVDADRRVGSVGGGEPPDARCAVECEPGRLTIHTAQEQLSFTCVAGFGGFAPEFLYECQGGTGTGRFATFEGWMTWELDVPAQPDRLAGLIAVDRMGGQTFQLSTLGTGALSDIVDPTCESGTATVRRLRTTFQHLGHVEVEAVRCDPLPLP
jgi:hypothetical protein